jgi:hypothetical protein
MRQAVTIATGDREAHERAGVDVDLLEVDVMAADGDRAHPGGRAEVADEKDVAHLDDVVVVGDFEGLVADEVGAGVVGVLLLVEGG